MKLRPLSEMKLASDAGPDHIPATWDFKRLKFLAKFRSGEGITSDEIREAGDYPVYGGNGLRGFTNRYTHDGDFVLIGRQGALCGNINYAHGKFWASEHAVVATLRSENSVVWFGELLRSLNLNQYSQSAAQPGLAVERIQNIFAPVPNPTEQKHIVNFLKAKLGRLDELMQKKARQLALLAEKRQALISHAVTRGLNPKVETRSSGIPQLGDVPAHWTPTRLKYLARIRYGLGQPPKSQADGVKMIRATNVDAGRITPENMALIDPSEVPESRDATLAAGEIIVVRSGAYTCDSAIIPPEYEGAIAGYDMIVRVKKAEPEFVAFSLLSGPVRDAQLKPCSLRAAQPHLNAEELGDCVLAVPPREEQQAIIRFLKTATTRLDAVAAAIKSQHTKLCEYRQALITAAVTGQVTIPEEAA